MLAYPYGGSGLLQRVHSGQQKVSISGAIAGDGDGAYEVRRCPSGDALYTPTTLWA